MLAVANASIALWCCNCEESSVFAGTIKAPRLRLSRDAMEKVLIGMMHKCTPNLCRRLLYWSPTFRVSDVSQSQWLGRSFVKHFVGQMVACFECNL